MILTPLTTQSILTILRMPLPSITNMLPFWSTAPPAAPKPPPVAVAPKEQPALRICFPLKIQRGGNSWWEYEEYRVLFRDRMIWRQAFGLDIEDSHEMSFNDGDPAFKSRWSSSTSAASSDIDSCLSGGSMSSKTSSQRLKHLMTRMLSATSSRSGKSREGSQSFTSSYSSSKRSTKQHQKLRPEPLKLLSKKMQSPDSEADETQRHRDDALLSLEGKSHAKNNMSFSAFKNMFNAREIQIEDVLSPVQRTFPSLQPKATPQDQRVINLSSEEWADLKDDILKGLKSDIGGIFPPYTEGQKVMVMPVQHVESLFRRQTCLPGDGMQRVGLKAALESIEASNWNDVVFVSYKDTPEVMKWWKTTREPRVLRWGKNML
ncbi:hypothetical protein THAR02_11054 [Trichoderma harzianum]|uniref:Uncharacterized protein n=1 Tax=Trichoderma harzianum TaxID=5544 RepID=A0A0F9Z8A6_TRIHA|nr:hypothetical protein THAR02_11054 [Trichoderma harzianum]